MREKERAKETVKEERGEWGTEKEGCLAIICNQYIYIYVYICNNVNVFVIFYQCNSS